MSKISDAFRNGKAFIGFVTGGDPTLDLTVELVVGMAEAGADIVEIGIPFSDPIAEGEVIQRANARALNAGASVRGIFGAVRKVRERTDVPIVFLTYLNPVFRYGYDEFFAECRDAGVDGVIIPDAPFEEQGEFKPSARKHGVDVISLVSPTSEDRIAKIAADADGYLYVVSSMGVTGVRGSISTDISGIVASIRRASDAPAAVGFGISTPEQACELSKAADGVIVGSAIVRIVEEYGKDSVERVKDYVRRMKAAISERP
ncbi:MAG: tryptophan synthase subunit alpha [Candidatus Methanoplasma sp.]|jgi:tryptophan synthase alpha chain|nr:tryptophan synthase subunit alpha [Candidatus Methanoplasma sp.]